MDVNDKNSKGLPTPKLIPEMSYDVICRVIPGAIVIGCILWLCQFNFAAAKLDLFVGLFLIALAYVIGFIVDSFLNHLINPWMIRYSWEIVEGASRKNEKLTKLTQHFKFNVKDVKENKAVSTQQKLNWLWPLLWLWSLIKRTGIWLWCLFKSSGRGEGEKPKNAKKNDPYSRKKGILERLREHVVTNFPYATSMMPKLNAEAALPRNLGVSPLLVFVSAVCCKILGWICREWSLLLWLLLPLGVTEVALYYTAKHKFQRVILRTLYWFWELEEKHQQLEEKHPQ